jgi:hypothetical protein
MLRVLAVFVDPRMRVGLVGTRSENTAVGPLVDGDGGEFVVGGIAGELRFLAGQWVHQIDVEVSGEARQIGGVGGVTHEDLSVRQRSRTAIGAGVGGAEVPGRRRIDDVERMQIEVTDRPIDGFRIDGVVGRIARYLVGTEGSIDDAEGARAVSGATIAEDGGKVFVGELDDFRHLLVSDGCALGEERVVVTTVEVDRPASWCAERPLQVLKWGGRQPSSG